MVELKLAKRFWKKVCIGGADQCWEWSAYRNWQGYGKIFVNGKAVNAQRVAYCLEHDLSLQDIEGRLILHSCDNPGCVNPKHLRSGDHQANLEDMQTRKREAMRVGEQNPNRKLSMEIVRIIRQKYTSGEANGVQLAKEFDVHSSTIYDMLRGKTWSFVL